MLYEPSPPSEERCRRATAHHHLDCVGLKQEIRAAAFSKRLVWPLTYDEGFVQDSHIANSGEHVAIVSKILKDLSRPAKVLPIQDTTVAGIVGLQPGKVTFTRGKLLLKRQ